MQNYQMGGEQNNELEEFLQRKIIELKRENEMYKTISLSNLHC